MADTWDVQPGELLTRSERAERFGGATQGGIQPSGSTPNVVVYSDPSRGETYGYNFDGWDADGTTFLYTGEGRTGDQELKAGNAAILNHQADGRALRVFVADDFVPGSRTKRHEYIGEFTTDPDRPYIIEDAPDGAGEPRKVYVFRLKPVGQVERTDDDTSVTGDAPTTSESQLIDPEAHDTPEFERSGTEPTTAQRRESDLVKRYEAHLQTQGHTTRRCKVRAAGQAQWMYTDTYDTTRSELTEAKGTTARSAVREAIGQLYDYERHIEPRPAALAVLLPGEPAPDLLELLRSRDMACIWEHRPGGFTRSEP